MKNRLQTKSILKELKYIYIFADYFFFPSITVIFRILRYYKEDIFSHLKNRTKLIVELLQKYYRVTSSSSLCHIWSGNGKTSQ